MCALASGQLGPAAPSTSAVLALAALLAGCGSNAKLDSSKQGRFSFFVTSLSAMRDLSGNDQGFGGDLRFGESNGLAGADRICETIAENSLAGAAEKGWRAFLSAVAGGVDGGSVNAIDRIGAGPWYDRRGRVVALNREALLHERPEGADPSIANDLPNETGTPNHMDGAPGCTGGDCPDNHDVLTGTRADGTLYIPNLAATCDDWTSSAPTGRPWCGHSWPRVGSGLSWISALAEEGCAPGINLRETVDGNATVGASGGYGAIYCFALSP